MEKKPEQKREILSTYNMSNYPKELQKKVLLLKHFKNYLEGDDKNVIMEKTFLISIEK